MIETATAIEGLAKSFQLALLARRRSPRTVQSYLEACGQLAAFLKAQGMPTDPEHVKREHVEAFIVALLARSKPATAVNRFKSLQQFFKWLEREHEITASPMANMEPPSAGTTNAPL